MNDFICLIVGLCIGAVLMLVVCSNIWTDAKAGHHKNAYNEFGQLTCEICKALAEKGASK